MIALAKAAHQEVKDIVGAVADADLLFSHSMDFCHHRTQTRTRRAWIEPKAGGVFTDLFANRLCDKRTGGVRTFVGVELT